MEECPLCFKRIHKDLLQSHVQNELDEQEGIASPTTTHTAASIDEDSSEDDGRRRTRSYTRNKAHKHAIVYDEIESDEEPYDKDDDIESSSDGVEQPKRVKKTATKVSCELCPICEKNIPTAQFVEHYEKVRQ